MVSTTTPLDSGWIDLINKNKTAMIFHHPAWIQTLADCYGYRPFIVGMRSHDGQLSAGTPVMEINSPITGRRWVSLPFSDFCSPLVQNDDVRRKITEEILSLAEAENIRNVELRGEYSHRPTLTTNSEFVLHEVALEQDCDQVFSRLHPMHRRNIKTARSKDIRIVRCNTREDLKKFYNLHLHSRRRQGVPIQPLKFFELLGKNLIEPGLGFLLLAYHEEQCIAGAVYLHWQDTLTYKYGASLPNTLHLRPNNLIMWEAIQWGCNNGFNKLDMGKTALSNEGLRTFKSRWGAREYMLPYTKLTAIEKKAHSGKLMGVLNTIIQRSPLWVCRLTGELLYGHFG